VTALGAADPSSSSQGTRNTPNQPSATIPQFKPGTVSISTFAYLFSELIQYSQSQVDNTGDLERRLEEVGRVLGGSLLELLHARSNIPASALPSAATPVGRGSNAYSRGSPLLYKSTPGIAYAPNVVTRYTRLLDILRFLYTTVWKYLFGKQATDLQQSNDNSDEYMISDDEAHLWMGRFVSVPKDMGSLNVYAFLAGVVQGVLEGAGFATTRVTAHFVPMKGAGGRGGREENRVTLLIKFDPSVMEREATLEKMESSKLL
jgi:hypothetical protein